MRELTGLSLASYKTLINSYFKKYRLIFVKQFIIDKNGVPSFMLLGDLLMPTDTKFEQFQKLVFQKFKQLPQDFSDWRILLEMTLLNENTESLVEMCDEQDMNKVINDGSIFVFVCSTNQNNERNIDELTKLWERQYEVMRNTRTFTVSQIPNHYGPSLNTDDCFVGFPEGYPESQIQNCLKSFPLYVLGTYKYIGMWKF